MANMPTTLDVEGIWKEWDRDEELREIMHNGGTILDPPACQDISTCIKHGFLLGPLVSKMAVHEKRPLPPIDPLKEELDNLFKKKQARGWKQFLGYLKKGMGFEETSWVCQDQSSATRGFHCHWVAQSY